MEVFTLKSTDFSKNTPNDDYEDLFSSFESGDFEDISSGRADTPQAEEADEFEDFFSGREAENAEVSPFDESFFTEMTDEEKENFAEEGETQPPTIPLKTPEKKPYSYHYDTAEQMPAKAKNGDEIYSDSPKKSRPKREKAKHLGAKITVSVIAVLLAVLIGLGFWGQNQLKALLSLVDTQPLKTNPYIAENQLLSSPDITNILLVGTDARAGEDPQKTRSDTMLLLSIDQKNKQIKQTSFLRDLYVDIPDYRKDKLNAAHAKGGTQRLIYTLETNFNVKIDGYFMVTFELFTTLVDALGGVDVEITEKEAKYINSKDHMAREDVEAFPEKLSAGKQHFSGQQALWYSRIRYLDSDFMRTMRQRKVLAAILTSAKERGVSALPQLVKNILPLVRTSYTEDELLKLCTLALKALSYETVEEQIPLQNAYKSERHHGQACLVPDMKKNRDAFHKFVFEKVEKSAEENKTDTKK